MLAVGVLTVAARSAVDESPNERSSIRPAVEAAAHGASVSPWVLDATAGAATADLLVVLAERADLASISFEGSLSARRHQVRDILWDTAQTSQRTLRAWLDDRGIRYRPFYIVNAILVRDASRGLVEDLAVRSEVARIAANPSIRQDLPELTTPSATEAGEAIEWNVEQIRADEMWALGFTGQNVVVGTQDTGFDWDHPALIRQYRGWSGSTANHDYNWHDAIHSGGGVCGPDSPEPCDDYGHGTLTTGVVVGDDGGVNRIGVAPGARWIGCRNMDEGVGTPATYLECLEFFLAPYPVGGTPADGDPDRAPDVTNNSWTCPASEGCDWDTLQDAFEAQRAAGIMTVVAAGNSGSSCSSVEVPPAIYDAVYTVGATNIFSEIASFSSRGPVMVDGSGRLKPDVSAPGEDVRSSAAGGGYQSASGTSLASPHVAGAVALLWSASPSLIGRIDATETIFNRTAEGWTSDQCGDPVDAVPNNVYGWGILDALSAYEVFDDGFESGTPYFWSVTVP